MFFFFHGFEGYSVSQQEKQDLLLALGSGGISFEFEDFFVFLRWGCGFSVWRKMNRALPEMLHCLNTTGNCPDTLSVLERQRARLKWQQDQLLQQQQQPLNQSCFNKVDYGGGFPPPVAVPADHFTGFPGYMNGGGGGGGGGLSLVEMVMGAVKSDPGLNDGWSEMGKFDPSLLLNATAYELNSSLSRTSSCPPAVAPTVAEKMGSAAGRDSFKKRKAEKVHNTTTTTTNNNNNSKASLYNMISLCFKTLLHCFFCKTQKQL